MTAVRRLNARDAHHPPALMQVYMHPEGLRIASCALLARLIRIATHQLNAKHVQLDQQPQLQEDLLAQRVHPVSSARIHQWCVPTALVARIQE